MSEEIEKIAAKISGKVQGVYFRASTKEEATKLGLKGFVRNELDGSVYLEAIGESEAIKQFKDWLAIGPKNAKVTEINIWVPEGEVDFDRFEIAYL